MLSMDLVAWVFGFNQREKDLGVVTAWLRERGATWEKKARELGGVLSLNQKRKGRKATCVSEKE